MKRTNKNSTKISLLIALTIGTTMSTLTTISDNYAYLGFASDTNQIDFMNTFYVYFFSTLLAIIIIATLAKDKPKDKKWYQYIPVVTPFFNFLKWYIKASIEIWNSNIELKEIVRKYRKNYKVFSFNLHTYVNATILIIISDITLIALN